MCAFGEVCSVPWCSVILRCDLPVVRPTKPAVSMWALPLPHQRKLQANLSPPCPHEVDPTFSCSVASAIMQVQRVHLEAADIAQHRRDRLSVPVVVCISLSLSLSLYLSIYLSLSLVSSFIKFRQNPFMHHAMPQGSQMIHYLQRHFSNYKI